MILRFVLLFSCGDDGRIRGWKWKEILESKASEQGNLISAYNLLDYFIMTCKVCGIVTLEHSYIYAMLSLNLFCHKFLPLRLQLVLVA